MPLKYYFLNRPVLCTRSCYLASSDPNHAIFGEIYFIRDVEIVKGKVVGYYFKELSVDCAGVDIYFPVGNFTLMYQSLLSEADTAARQLVQQLSVDVP